MALHYSETSLPVVNLLWAGWIFGLASGFAGLASFSKSLWAVLFVALAVLQILAIIRNARTARRISAGVNIAVWAFWFFAIATSELHSPAIPLTVFVIYLASVALVFHDALSHKPTKE